MGKKWLEWKLEDRKCENWTLGDKICGYFADAHAISQHMALAMHN